MPSSLMLSTVRVGLALGRTLVEVHSGSVTANSEGVGREASSWFACRCRFRESKCSVRPKRGFVRPSPARVLIIDDKEDAAIGTAMLLQVSGFSRDQDKQRALGAGFDAYLTKPAALDALLADLADLRPTPGAY